MKEGETVIANQRRVECVFSSSPGRTTFVPFGPRNPNGEFLLHDMRFEQRCLEVT